MPNLTKRQKQILDYLKSFIEKKGYSPTVEEMRKHFKLSAISTIHEHLKTLEDKGFIKKDVYRARGVELLEEKKIGKISIPLLGAIAAGQPIEAIEEKNTITVPKNKLPGSGNFFALKVQGDSMINENICDGDTILVKSQFSARDGETVVALIDNYEVTLKKIYKEKNRIRLQPENSNMDPIFVKPENLIIQGVVTDVIKNINYQLKKEFVATRKENNIEDFLDKVIKGDCIDVMKKIPAKSIDMILCDLPYGTTQNDWDSIIPLNKLWNEYERIIKDNGVIALTSQGIFTAQLIMSNPKIFKYKLVWEKSKSTNFLNAKKQPLRKHEDVCIFYKKQPVYNPQMKMGEPYNKGHRKNQLTGSYGDFNSVQVKSDGKRYPNDIIYFKTAESEGEVLHPTQKPVELGRYLIKTYTNKDAIILDNTCGSGSFLVSAVLEERKFIGIEKNEETYLHKNKKVDYIEVCEKRINYAKNKIKFSNKKFNF